MSDEFEEEWNWDNGISEDIRWNPRKKRRDIIIWKWKWKYQDHDGGEVKSRYRHIYQLKKLNSIINLIEMGY